MTPQEAIKYLEHHGYISDDVKDMCIEALKKQTPQKLSCKGIGYETYCQSCGLLISEYDDENHFRYDYCPNCGQALDWSDEEWQTLKK